jgi:hypothetical protein
MHPEYDSERDPIHETVLRLREIEKVQEEIREERAELVKRDKYLDAEWEKYQRERIALVKSLGITIPKTQYVRG